MNILSIDIETSEQGHDLALMKIDGCDFIEIVKDIEFRLAQATAEQPLAGAYDYLPIHLLKYPSLRLLGEAIPEDLDIGDGKVTLLDCPCGELGCWPLRARISRDGAYVHWSDFEQPNREAWVYPESFKFVFLRSQLEQATHF